MCSEIYVNSYSYLENNMSATFGIFLFSWTWISGTKTYYLSNEDNLDFLIVVKFRILSRQLFSIWMKKIKINAYLRLFK